MELSSIVPLKHFPQVKLEKLHGDIVINAMPFSSFLPKGGWRNRWHGVYTIPKKIQIQQKTTLKAQLAGGQYFDTCNPLPEPFHHRIRNQQADFRLANGFLCWQDQPSEMTFGFFVTHQALYAFYGKLHLFEPTEEQKVNKPAHVQTYTVDNFDADPEYKEFRKHLNKDIFRSMLIYERWKSEALSKNVEKSIFDIDAFHQWFQHYLPPSSSKDSALEDQVNDYIFHDKWEYYCLWQQWNEWTQALQKGKLPIFSLQDYLNDPLYMKAKSGIAMEQFLMYKTYLEWKRSCDSYHAKIDNYETFLTFRYTPKLDGLQEWMQTKSYDDYVTYIQFLMWYRKLKIFHDKVKGEPIQKMNQFQSDVNFDGHFMSVKKVSEHSGCNPLHVLYDVEISVDPKNGTAVWYVSGKKAWLVNQIGHRADKTTRVYDTGGYSQHVDVSLMQVYFGCGQFLDALEPDEDWRKVMMSNHYEPRSALVKMEELYYNPINNFKGEIETTKKGYFAIESFGQSESLFGQGAVLRIAAINLETSC